MSDHLPVRQIRREWLELLPAAGRDLTTPYPEVSPADRLAFLADGDRERYEGLVAERHRLLSAAVLAAAATGEPVAVDRVAEGVHAFCDQESWCWPAHDDWDPERHFLDLGAGEVAAQLAWAEQLTGDLVEARHPGTRARVREHTHARVLQPFLGRDDWHWLGLDGDVHNWLPWIAGNVLTAGLVLARDAALQHAVVARAEACLWRYVDALPADGAIDEGCGYWWNGACRAIEALELLEHATGAAGARWRTHPTLRATVGFPSDMYLGGGWWVNVADGSARPGTDLAWPSLFRAARALGNRDAEALALAHREPLATSEVRRLGRLVLELADPDWWQVPDAGAALPGEAWYPSVQLLVTRQRAGSTRGLTLVAKGGHNGEHHNHNDVGSFIVALDGVPVIVDVGRPTYTGATFTAERYSIWTMTSGWHNVPVVAGCEQEPGAAHAARDVAVTRGGDRPGMALDLAGAYPAGAARSWRRTLGLDRELGRVTCHEAWQDQAPGGSVAVLVVAGAVQQVADDEIIVQPLEGERRLRVVSERPMVVERRELDDDLLTRVWGSCVNRIKIDLGSDKSSHASTWFEALGKEG